MAKQIGSFNPFPSFPRRRESRPFPSLTWIPARAGLRQLGRNDDGSIKIQSAICLRTLIAIVCAGIIFSLAGISEAEKIRTAIPQANLNYLSIHVADAKGFYKDEGLDNETVVISGPLSIAAMLSGDVDYSGAGGSGMRAALKGAPIKGIHVSGRQGDFLSGRRPEH